MCFPTRFTKISFSIIEDIIIETRMELIDSNEEVYLFIYISTLCADGQHIQKQLRFYLSKKCMFMVKK